MEGKYAVTLSITDLIKISRKLRKRYNGRLWKMQMWSDFNWKGPKCKGLSVVLAEWGSLA